MYLFTSVAKGGILCILLVERAQRAILAEGKRLCTIVTEKGKQMGCFIWMEIRVATSR